jgi:translation initiation factor 2 beta subunit (eIF-2beta)/eIF-5
MGFQDGLERKRAEQAQAASATADRVARARASAIKTAREGGAKLIPEVREAAEALRADRERSERALRGSSRYGGIIGTIQSSRRVERPRAWYQLRPTYETHHRFEGWWVRYKATDSGPFEVEIPLDGDVRVVRYASNFESSPSDRRWTLEAFVDGGVYEYTRGGDESPVRHLEVTAARVLSDALRIIEDHLLHLPTD